MEEYSKDTERIVSMMYEFVGENFKVKSNETDEIWNEGAVREKPVLPETVQLLDQFFKPFNAELADMLEDEKWLFERT